MPEKRKLVKTKSRDQLKNISQAYYLPHPSSSDEDEVSKKIPLMRKIVIKKYNEKQRLMEERLLKKRRM